MLIEVKNYRGTAYGKESLGELYSNNRASIQIIFQHSGLFVKKTSIFAVRKSPCTMIQRIQTFFLILVALISGVLPFVLSLWIVGKAGVEVFAKDELWISIAFYSSALLAIISIFMYKKRQNQFVLNRLNIILNLFLLGFFVYRSLSLSGETEVSEKGIGMLIPVFSIVFLVLANRAIKKDEDLVKSVDRLR